MENIHTNGERGEQSESRAMPQPPSNMRPVRHAARWKKWVEQLRKCWPAQPLYAESIGRMRRQAAFQAQREKE